jgi:single-stranded-DNA-specific exonuclease
VDDQGQIRGITKRWRARSPAPTPIRDPQPAGVAEQAPTQSLVDRVLRARGIDPAAADAYLNPSLLGMHDPGGIPDIDKAARRILDAATAGERIVVYGDYDVDGITAAAILVHTLRTIRPGADLHTYIPHRLDEGYGINAEAIAQLAEKGARVIVSVDCGITAIEPARVARDIGVDLIITDHHNPPASMDDLPDAFAVVHPRRPDSAYPFGELCGAGVAYKLAWRMATMHAGGERVSPECRAVLVEMLGLAALGSIADVVPLVDENRVIVRHGLIQVARTRNEGLRALIHASRLDSDKVDAEAVGFRLAPRLNAAGRLGHAREALELLTDATGARATTIAESLSRVNDERRAVERTIVDQACAMAEAAGMTGDDRRAIVLAHPDWHPGVVGIVCSRLVEKYARPVLLLQKDGNVCKGSGRSIPGFNLHAGLAACADLLDRFGGHDMAAGMACSADNLAAFTDRFTEHTNTLLGTGDLVHELRYDTAAELPELTPRAVEQLERLSPFGPGNARVRLRVRGRLIGKPDALGARGDHVAFRLSHRGADSETLRVVAWNWAPHANEIPPGAAVEVIVEPKLSRWNGNTRVEPVLCDLRLLTPEEAARPDHSAGAVAYAPARS